MLSILLLTPPLKHNVHNMDTMTLVLWLDKDDIIANIVNINMLVIEIAAPLQAIQLRLCML